MSAGAFAVAVTAGVLELADGVQLSKRRAERMLELYPKGYGLAAIVGLTEKQVSTLVEGAFTARDPLVDLRFFHSVPFSSATLLGLCAFASFAGFLFLNTLYLQQVLGFSAFGTGVFTLPEGEGVTYAGTEQRNRGAQAG